MTQPVRDERSVQPLARPSRPDIRIAVIVIGRNEGQRLGQSLESVKQAAARYAGRTGERVEIIYIDSQSTDNSVQIARDLGIRVAVAPPAYRTCTNARMTGLLLTESEYVMFVDGDMELAAHWLIDGAHFLDATPHAAGVCGLRDDMRSTAAGIVRISNYFRTVKEVEPVSGDVGGAFLLRRSALLAIGGLEADLAPEEDYFMFCKLSVLGLALFRIRQPMIVHWDTKIASPMQAFRHIAWHSRATVPGLILRRALLEGWASTYLWHFKRNLILHALWLALCLIPLGLLFVVPAQQEKAWLICAGTITLLYLWLIWKAKFGLARTVLAIPLRTVYLLHLLIGWTTGRPRVAFGVQLTDAYRKEVQRLNTTSRQTAPASAARISFVVVAHNAAACLPMLLQDLLAQDYPAEHLETLLVASTTSPDTEAVMESFRAAHPERCIRVLRNPKVILAAGWNVALAQATGDIIVRVDAHARIAPSFLSQSVAAVQNDDFVIAGGHCQTILPEGRWPLFLAIVEASKFGSGAASWRNARAAGYVDTLAYAAYRREAFASVGGYDERLKRTEDNEIHYRMKKAGYRFFYSPEIQSRHFARSAFRTMLRQKYGNGLWIGLTMAVQPRCFSLRHFAPMVFTLALALALGLGLARVWMPLLALLGVYAAAAAGFALREMMRPEAAPCRWIGPLMPAVFFLLHTAYGVGTMLGLAGMPWFWYVHRKYHIPRPIPLRSQEPPIKEPPINA